MLLKRRPRGPSAPYNEFRDAVLAMEVDDPPLKWDLPSIRTAQSIVYKISREFHRSMSTELCSIPNRIIVTRNA